MELRRGQQSIGGERVFKSIKRIEALEEKMDKLMVYVPKLYQLLVNMKPAYPCEKYQQEMCVKCSNTSCIYHPETTVKITADEIMREFIKMGNR